MDRSETIAETAHDVWEIFRYGSYTDELLYTGTGPGAPTVILPNGLRYYRGGYQHIVSDQDKADLIASGLVTSANFILIPDGAVTITSVNGYTGPVVVLAYTDVGANKLIDVHNGYLTAGNSILANTAGLWLPVPGLEVDQPAVAGDYVEFDPSFMWQPVGSQFIDIGVVVGSTIVRYASSGGSSPAAANEGDPSLYPGLTTFRTSGAKFGFRVTSGDLDTGNVRFCMLTRGDGSGSVIYSSSNYPFRYIRKNYGQ